MCLQLISSPQSQGISGQRVGWRGGGGGGKNSRAWTGGRSSWTDLGPPFPYLGRKRHCPERWGESLGSTGREGVPPTPRRSGTTWRFQTVHLLCCWCCLVAKSCVTLCDRVDCSMPGLPVPHHLPEFAQVHVHWVGDAIEPSHPLPPSSPFAFNLSQYRGLFQWVNSLHQVPVKSFPAPGPWHLLFLLPGPSFLWRF